MLVGNRHMKGYGLLSSERLSWLYTFLLVLAASKGDSLGAAEQRQSIHQRSRPSIQDTVRPGSEKAGQEVWIIDTFPYNGEMVAKLRLKHLFKVVDEFLVVESTVTHSGKRKEFLYVERDWKVFEPYLSKVSFLIIEAFPAPEEAWVERNTGGWMRDPNAWHREMYQRDIAASKISEKYIGRKFVVLCSDADEIPNGEFARELRSQRNYDEAQDGFYMAMNFSYYNFDWASPQIWVKGFAVSDVGLTKHTLSDYRMGNPHDGTIRQDGGWHFSYYMSAADIARKLDAFGHTEYNTPQYKDPDHLRRCLHEGKDLFNRGPTFDMLHASNDRIAGYPEGWEDLATELAELQKLPAVHTTRPLKQTPSR